METIKVNMNPNPLDVQTIHASQNDGEARQWEFELHNNGELIDTSDVKEQLVFKAYKGGTEQLLPENGSTPTTSPFLGDIRYPQGLLTDQEFTYRQSPTESDGLAWIKSIKGNTLVWNQLVQNGNFADSSGWRTISSASLTISNNIATITTVNSWSGFGSIAGWPLVSDHKYLFNASYKIETADYEVNVYSGNLFDFSTISCIADNQWHTIQQIVTCVQSGQSSRPSFDNRSASGTYSVKNIMLIDLTQMFGAGKEPATVEEFTSLFPLPYYAYNAGTLLSFNGTGLKTGGKNLIDFSTLEIGKNWTESSAVDRTIIEFAVEENKEYTISFDYSSNVLNAILVFKDGWNVGQIGNIDMRVAKTYTFTTPSTCKVVCVQFNARINGFVLSQSDFYGFWNCALTDTFSTKALPVSTYFPTGMKSAGNVYDELTKSKAITRIGELNIDSSMAIATWESSDGWTANITLNSYKPNGAIKSDKFEYIGSFNGASSFASSAKAKGGYCLGTWENSNRVYFYSSSATTSNDLINAIRGTNLNYELATPTETEFTTASLVTENGEIPLSNEDGTLIGKCTEQLSAEPGFHDAKIKLADGDGECYSNKIQLHVERSPQ